MPGTTTAASAICCLLFAVCCLLFASGLAWYSRAVCAAAEREPGPSYPGNEALDHRELK